MECNDSNQLEALREDFYFTWEGMTFHKVDFRKVWQHDLMDCFEKSLHDLSLHSTLKVCTVLFIVFKVLKYCAQ